MKEFDLVYVMGKIVDQVFVDWIPVIVLELTACNPAWSPFVREVCVSVDCQVAEVIIRVELLNHSVKTVFFCISQRQTEASSSPFKITILSNPIKV